MQNKRIVAVLVSATVCVIASWQPLLANLLANQAEVELRHITAASANPALQALFWGAGIRSALPAPEQILSRQPELPCAQANVPGVGSVIDKLRRTQELRPAHAMSTRLLARAYLFIGNPAKAVSLLLTLRDRYGKNSLLDVYLGDAYDALGEPSAAIGHYSIASTSNREEQVVVNYVLLAERARTKSSAKAWLTRASAIDPSNLYITYLLFLVSRETGDMAKVTDYRDQLRHFGVNGLNPPCDLRLQTRMQYLVPQLVIEGIWSTDTAVQLLGEWVHAGRWKEAGIIAERLWEIDSANSRLAYLRGLINQQLGDIDAAKESYQRAINAVPKYAPAYYGMSVWLDNEGESQRAIESLTRSYTLTGDLFSLRKLVDLCGPMRNYECAETSYEELMQRTGDVSIISRLLNVDESEVALGPNLLSTDNDGSTWYWLPMFSSKVWNQALFVGRKEKLGQDTDGVALHVIGFWAMNDPDFEPARAGFAGPGLSVQPKAKYVMSFLYKTDGLHDGQATVYLSKHSEALFAGDYLLKETHGAWHKFVVVGQNRSSETIKIIPRLRSFGIGNVWFKDIAIRQILEPDDLEISETVFETR